jgi:hypothetical protein
VAQCANVEDAALHLLPLADVALLVGDGAEVYGESCQGKPVIHLRLRHHLEEGSLESLECRGGHVPVYVSLFGDGGEREAGLVR